MSTNFHTNVGSADPAAFLQFQTCFRPLWDAHKFPYKCRVSGHSCFPTFSDGFRPVSDLLIGTSTNFHTNVGSADIAAFLQFQTVSDLFRPLWDVHKFPYNCRITADIAAFLQFQTCFRPLWDDHKFPCFPTVSDGFRPVSDLFGTSTNFHTNVGSADLAAIRQFQTVSDLFGMSTNFHTNVGSADIAAFLHFQRVSDLFQTSLGCPQNSIQMKDQGIQLLSYSFRRFQTCFRPLWDVHKFPYKCRISGSSCLPTVSDGFRPVSDLFGTSTIFHTNVGSADLAAFLQFQTVSDLFQTSLGCPQISIQM